MKSGWGLDPLSLIVAELRAMQFDMALLFIMNAFQIVGIAYFVVSRGDMAGWLEWLVIGAVAAMCGKAGHVLLRFKMR